MKAVLHKSRFAAILSFAALWLIAALALVSACSGREDSGANEPEKYAITAEASDDYKITVADEAAEGEAVTFTVNVTNPDKYICGATYNDIALSSENNTFSFYMPDKEVTLTAVLADREEVLVSGPSDFVQFNLANSRNLTSNSGVVSLRLDISFDRIFNLSCQARSSDQSVIPDSAITITDYRPEGSISEVEAVIVQIDTSAVSQGVAWLEIDVRDSNASTIGGTIVVRIIVT